MAIDLGRWQTDLEELFRIETSADDRRNNPEVRKSNRFLKRNRRKVNRIIKLQRKVMGYR